MKSRIFNIAQYFFNPATGEPLLTMDDVKSGLNHKTITRYAYCIHDKDVYLKDEKGETGTPKPSHIHIVLQMNQATELATISKWFNIPEQYVDVPKGRKSAIEVQKGRGAFIDCVRYLTHESDKEQEKGKYRYEDECVVASFDFRKEIDDNYMHLLRYGYEVGVKQDLMYKVAFEGMTLRQCKKKEPFIYLENIEKFKKLRLEYILNSKPPTTRINYYVSGRGGLGKGLISRALARSLFPELDDDNDIYHITGSGKALFEGYDGQPVIIWDDKRAIDLLNDLEGRGNVFNVFDTHPQASRQNIKYGSINLCNKVNIINSVQPYKEFLDGLAGEYVKNGITQKVEDKGQSYRRFPFIINLHEEDFDLLLNSGFYNESKDFEQYYEYKSIQGNMQRIATMCSGREELAKQIEQKTLTPVVNVHNQVVEKMDNIVEKTDEDILAKFSHYGEIKPNRLW